MQTWNSILCDAAHAFMTDEVERAYRGSLVDGVNLNCFLADEVISTSRDFSADNKGAGQGIPDD